MNNLYITGVSQYTWYRSLFMHEATSTYYLIPPISGFSEFFFVLLCVKIKQKSHLFNLFAVLMCSSLLARVCKSTVLTGTRVQSTSNWDTLFSLALSVKSSSTWVGTGLSPHRYHGLCAGAGPEYWQGTLP